MSTHAPPLAHITHTPHFKAVQTNEPILAAWLLLYYLDKYEVGMGLLACTGGSCWGAEEAWTGGSYWGAKGLLAGRMGIRNEMSGIF